MVSYISMIRDNSFKAFRGYSTIEYNDIITALINLLSFQESKMNIELKITCLQILRKLVE